MDKNIQETIKNRHQNIIYKADDLEGLLEMRRLGLAELLELDQIVQLKKALFFAKIDSVKLHAAKKYAWQKMIFAKILAIGVGYYFAPQILGFTKLYLSHKILASCTVMVLLFTSICNIFEAVGLSSIGDMTGSIACYIKKLATKDQSKKPFEETKEQTENLLADFTQHITTADYEQIGKWISVKKIQEILQSKAGRKYDLDELSEFLTEKRIKQKPIDGDRKYLIQSENV